MAAITVTNITPQATKPLKAVSPKRSLRGASGGLYVGPIIGTSAIEGPPSPTHSTGEAAGGVEDSTGYRESDTYARDGSSGGLLGGAATAVTRPTGRTAYIGDGVVGGSTPGSPIDPSNFDKRSTVFGDSGAALGNSGRGSNVDGETVVPFVGNTGRPTLGGSENPAGGTVALVGGAGKVQVDLNAADITGGANSRKGARIAMFKRGTDTDTDGDFVALFDADGGTDITDAVTSLAAATYAWYAAWRYAGNAGQVEYGPFSARGTVAVA